MGGIAGIGLENNMNDLSKIITMTNVIKHQILSLYQRPMTIWESGV